tara:strand:- start:6 stop:275 length:270 start_codon:yes stop_codon:yes gene_type:complete
MSNKGRDLFDDAKMHTLVKLKDDIDPTAVFIGRNHSVLGYGQTGILLFDGDNDPTFLPDNDDDTTEEHKVIRKDVVRTQELLINPAPYS